ncbi:MAG: outer membrane lipoprotein chaperone LolA [Ramlibacter sp.]|nr:outer membrane lipoprotein chaperone LolA [Ramlibacter sp.]
MKKTLLTLGLVSCAWAAQASGIDALESFVKNAKSGRADFTQAVTAPSKEGQAGRTKTSSGTFEFVRPNRFRFNYKKPFEQTIVADGQTLWLYDADLRQVTQRKQAQVLAQTPAALIASAPDLATLRKDFNLEAAPDANGLQWVQATPRVKEGQLNYIKVGFRGSDLAVLEILDGFGQKSVMTFNKMETNAAVGPEVFNFKPPQNSDVIKQ